MIVVGAWRLVRRGVPGDLSGSRFGCRLWRFALAALLPAAVLLLWAAPGASAANRIYWGSCGSISFANLNGTGHGGDLNAPGATLGDCPTGIAMDLARGKLYWAGFFGNTISFAKLDDTGGGDLNTTGAVPPQEPAGVATDPATGRIYWGDLPVGFLSFAKLNDTGGGGELSKSGASYGNVFGVAIDPATGKIYWAAPGYNTISFANLDGTGQGGDLNTSGATVNEPEGLAIDPANGKIYWANNGDDTHPISFANLNDTGGGGDLNVTGASPNGAVGVAIDPKAGKIYWADVNGNTISFAKLNDTGGGGELETTGASTPNFPKFPALLKAPLATAKPRISRGSAVGSRLFCTDGKWAPDLLESFLYQRPVSFSYRWSRNGKRILGATDDSITAARAGAYTCTVTAINEAGGTKNTSTSHTVTR